MKVSNKTFIVTGAGSGIGRELTIQLLRKGANVAGIDINLTSLLVTQNIAGVSDEHFKGFVFDITNREKVDALPAEVLNHFKVVDGLINNAGIIQNFKSVNELSIEEIHRVINVNFFGTVYLTKAFLPWLLERPEAHIVNVSSMGGFIPFPGQTIYGAAKAAVKIFTEGLYSELKNSRVRVTVVHPGAILTNITENSGLGKPKMPENGGQNKMALSSSRAAEIIIHAMITNKYRVMVGRDATILDIIYRLTPKFATNLIGKLMKKHQKEQ